MPPRPDKRLLADRIISDLERLYPDATIPLRFRGPYQLLVATILSAQCTDEQVNRVTPAFFERWPDAPSLAAADLAEVESVIYSTGFFRRKARHLVAAARMIRNEHGGEVPDTMEALTRLPGVARKTANIVLSYGFGRVEGIAVDTHVKRLSGLLGLSTETDPNKIERDLQSCFRREDWHKVNHLLIWHGRRVCVARRPRCGECPLSDLCPSARVG